MPKIEQERINPETGGKYYVPVRKGAADAAPLAAPSTTDDVNLTTPVSTQESILVGRTGRTGERGPTGATGAQGPQGTPGAVKNVVFGPTEPDHDSIWIDSSDETTSWEDETLITALSDQVSEFAERVDALANVFNTAIDPGFFQDINPGTTDTKLGSVAHVQIKRGYKDKLTREVTRYTISQATLTDPGTGYTVADVVILFPGVSIKVDTITGGAGTGPIGNFTATLPDTITVPTQINPVPVTGGTGSGATFTLTYVAVTITVPILLDGELGFCIDNTSRELYIGYDGASYLLAKSGGGTGGGGSSGTLTGAYVELVTTNGSKYRLTMNDDGQLVIINSVNDTALSPPPGAASLYDGLVISKVYGGGAIGSNTTPVSHSFIELYNQSEPPVTFNLKGLAIQWGQLEQLGQPMSWKIAPLRGEIKPHTGFLIRGAMHSNPYLQKTRFKINDFDMSIPDMAISANGFKIYLNIPADLTKPTTYINPANIDNSLTKEDGYLNLFAVGGETQLIDAFEKRASDLNSFARFANKFRMIKRTFSHDIGAGYSSNVANVFAVYGNSYDDLEYIDMMTADIALYTPRSQRYGQWSWFWDQMGLDPELPSNLTISFGKDGDHDRIFTWHSPAAIDQNYLMYHKSTDAAWIRLRAQSTIVALPDSVVNVNMVAIRGLTPGTYVYKVGSEARWTDEYQLEVKAVAPSDTIKMLQVTDQQGWGGYEYQVWEKANAVIEANETYDFIFNTGDITQNASRPFEWRYYSYFAKNNFYTHVHQMIVGNNDLIASDQSKQSTTQATFTGEISTNVSTNTTTLTVTAVATGNGKLLKDVVIVGPGIAPATKIVQQLTGDPVGGIGTYRLNIAQEVESGPMSGVTITTIVGTKGDPVAFTYYLTMDAFYKLTATTTLNSTDLTNVTNASKIVGINDAIVGPGIQTGTRAVNMIGSTVSMDKAATATGSTTLTFTPANVYPSVYSFNYGFCHFIGLNSNIVDGFANVGEATPEQIDFIRKDMAIAANQKRWVIVALHEAPYTLASSAKLRPFINVFDEVGVDLVICGHHHCYARSNKMGGIPTLLHLDANISATSDASFKVWTANGGAVVSTARKKFGTASMQFDGQNDYLSVPATGDFAFGNYDFTIDCWIYVDQYKANATILSNAVTTLGPTAKAIMLDATGHVVFRDGLTIALTSTAIVPTAQFTHVALTRRLGIVRLYIGGQFQSPSVAMAGDVDFSLNGTLIGKNGWDTSGTAGANNSFFVGNIDEFHAIKKAAKWSTNSNFTPPVAAYGAGIDDNDTVIGASLTGSVTANVLTVTVIDPGCLIKDGAVLTGGTLSANTSIIGQLTIAAGSAAGGLGTYSTTATANTASAALVTDAHIPGGYHFLSQATGYKLIGKTNPSTVRPWCADFDGRIDALGPMYVMYEISQNQIAIKPYRLQQLTPPQDNVGKQPIRVLYHPFTIIKP